MYYNKFKSSIKLKLQYPQILIKRNQNLQISDVYKTICITERERNHLRLFYLTIL